MKIEINSYIRHGSLREIHWQATSPGRTGQPHVYASGHGIVVSQNEHSVTLDNGVDISQKKLYQIERYQMLYLSLASLL